MTEKQHNALKTILSALPEDCRESYREIAAFSVSLYVSVDLTIILADKNSNNFCYYY